VKDNLCVVGLYLVGFRGLSSLFFLLLTRFFLGGCFPISLISSAIGLVPFSFAWFSRHCGTFLNAEMCSL